MTRGPDVSSPVGSDALVARGDTAVDARDPAWSAWVTGRRAAWMAALLAPPIAMSGQFIFDWIVTQCLWLGFNLPGAVAFGNGVILPLGGALLVGGARVVAPLIRQAAARSKDHGRAAAAGASMAAAASMAAMIFGVHLYHLATIGSAWVTLGLLRLFAASIGVGLLGGYFFREAEAVSSAKAPELPPFYRFLRGGALPVVAGHFGLAFLGMSPFGIGGAALVGMGLLGGAVALARGPRAELAPAPNVEVLPP